MIRVIPAVLVLSLACAPAAELQWEPLNEPGVGGWLTSLRVNPKDASHLVLGGDMLGLGRSIDGGASWKGGRGLASWEIGDVTFDHANPEIVWAGTMSGPFVSRDGGTTWESRRNGLPEASGGFYSVPIQKILIDPANPHRLLAFAGSYRGWASPGSPKFGFVWESLDGGESWHDFSSIKAYRNITWVDADRDWKRIYAVVESRGVYTSEDRGKTWTPASNGIPKNGGTRVVAVHPKDPDTAWVATGNEPVGNREPGFLPGGIYKTVDGGATWSKTGQGLPQNKGTNPNFTTRFQAIAVSALDSQQLVTSDTSYDHNAVYHSADGGNTWQVVLDGASQKAIPTGYPAGMGATVITFDPTNVDTFYIANSETVLRTNDRGKTWVDLSSSLVSDDPVKTFRGHGYSGLCSTRVIFNPFLARSVILTAMDAGKHIRSDDGRQSWFFHKSGFSQPWGGANDAVFAKPDGKIVYLATGQHGGQGGVARTDDGGLTWREFSGSAFGLGESNAEASSIHCDPDRPDRAWAVVSGNLFATEDGGKSWTKVPGFDRATVIGRIEGQAFPFYVGDSAGIHASTDGRQFELLPQSPQSARSIRVDGKSPDRPFAVVHRGANSGVFQRDGDVWKRIFENSFASDVAIHPTNASRLAISTSDDPFHDTSDATGVWLTEDGGATWQQANAGLPCLRGLTISFDPHHPDTLVFGTFGRGYFQASWPMETSDVSKDVQTTRSAH